jgi:glutamine synthetase
MLASGLDGIEHNLQPPEPIEKDIYHMSKEERKRLKIDSLPESLGQALEIFSQSKLMKETLGEHIFTHYMHIKTAEWDEYRTWVTDWEQKRYLRNL